jgi:predicted O-methyltransferase YrrM
MRESLKFAVEHFQDRPVVSVEVGVAAGANAMKIFKALNTAQMFLIDSWTLAYNHESHAWLLETCKAFERLTSKVFIVRHQAIGASQIFNKDQIDYLYLDDNHAPQHVYNELVAYYDKVKSGGIMAGHDWADNGRASKAVKEFCAKNDLEYSFAQNDGEKVADWWIVKP